MYMCVSVWVCVCVEIERRKDRMKFTKMRGFMFSGVYIFCSILRIYGHALFYQQKIIKLFKIYLFIYLFIWLHRVLFVEAGLLSCSRQAPQLWHVNSQLQHVCGIQFPDQGSNPGPLHQECGVLSTVPPGKSHIKLFFS